MFQMKEQDETPEEVSEVELSNLPNKEFSVMIIKKLEELERKLDEQKIKKFITKS